MDPFKKKIPFIILIDTYYKRGCDKQLQRGVCESEYIFNSWCYLIKEFQLS